MARAELIKAETGQDLVFIAREGRPTATPTVAIKNQHGSTKSAAADTNVTLDTVDTTVASNAAIGAKLLTLTSGSGVVVGRTYLLTSARAEIEWVRVVYVDSAEVGLDEPLAHAHDATSTFESTRFTYACQTADVANLAERMQAVAIYAVAGETHTQRQLFDVVLHALPNPLTRAVLASDAPDLGLAEWAEQAGSDYERQRDVAWDIVLTRLRQLDRRPALIADVEDLKLWALAELAMQLQLHGVKVIRNVDGDVALDILEKRLIHEKESAITGLSWYDEDEDGAVGGEEETQPLKLDFVR